MSVATAIAALEGRVANAYDAAEAKGATLPVTKNTANLPAAISSIPSGSQSVYGISSITQLVGENVNGTLTQSQTPFTLDMTGIKTIPDNGLDSKFYGNTELTSVSFPDLESVGEEGMRNAFYNCTNLIDNNGTLTISFPKLSSVAYHSFNQTFCGVLHQNTSYGVSDTLTVNFPALTTINANTVFYRMFYILNNNAILNTCTVNFPVLTSASGNLLFQSFINADVVVGGDAAVTFNFPELTSLTCGTTSTQAWFHQLLTAKRLDVYMPKCTSITNNFIFPSNNKSIFHIHFAAANQNAIETTTGYATHFGSTKVNVLFDL